MTQHIDEMDEVRVGQLYWVPHVQVKPKARSKVWGLDGDGWIACRGDLHSDPEIGFHPRHWHYDGRFLSNEALRLGLSHALGWALNVDMFEEGDGFGIVYDRPPVLRRREVLRVGGVVDLNPHVGVLEKRNSTWQAERLPGRDCRRCPHKGALLQSSEVAGAQIICPLHGLRFDLVSGHLIQKE